MPQGVSVTAPAQKESQSAQQKESTAQTHALTVAFEQVRFAQQSPPDGRLVAPQCPPVQERPEQHVALVVQVPPVAVQVPQWPLMQERPVQHVALVEQVPPVAVQVPQ